MTQSREDMLKDELFLAIKKSLGGVNYSPETVAKLVKATLAAGTYLLCHPGIIEDLPGFSDPVFFGLKAINQNQT